MTARAEASGLGGLLALFRASHPGPSVSVTAVAVLLSYAEGLPGRTMGIVAAAVLTGQLSIGWGNDLLDADRDRKAGRTEKPLARGQLTHSTVRRWAAASALACVLLSLLAGWLSGLIHLLGVGFGHLYNSCLKSTAWSWVPYAVAFGSFPAVVSLAGSSSNWPPAWMAATAATAGMAAHFLNVLPDFEADAATGVQGLPHRLGTTANRLVAAALVVLASATSALGLAGAPAAGALGVLGVTALSVVSLIVVCRPVTRS